MFRKPKKDEGISLMDFSSRSDSDEEIKLSEPEQAGEKLEDFLIKISEGIQNAKQYLNEQFPELLDLNTPDKLSQLSQAIDNYLKLQESVENPRYSFTTMNRKFSELRDQLNNLRFHDDVHPDIKAAVQSFVQFINTQFRKFSATPTTEKEKASYPLLKKLEEILNEFSKDLNAAKKISTNKPYFGYSKDWTVSIDALTTKFQTKPNKLLDLLAAIEADFNNIPPKIQQSLRELIEKLQEEAKNFKSLYVDQNKSLDPTARTKATGFFETILAKTTLQKENKPGERKENTRAFR